MLKILYEEDLRNVKEERITSSGSIYFRPVVQVLCNLLSNDISIKYDAVNYQ